MKAKLFQNKLCVKKSSIHGYGVFAAKAINKAEIVEECYALFLHKSSEELIDYVFTPNILLTGYGSLYNHNSNHNASHYYVPRKKIMVFKAKRFIPEGTEIFINYGKEWFTSRGIKMKSTRKKSK